jgi:hypothetical protein
MTDLSSIVHELEQQRDAIDRALAALRGVGGNGRSTNKTPAKAIGTPRKRQMSEAGRKRIAEATRQRWAAKRAMQATSHKAGLKQPTAKKAGSKKLPSRSKREQR